MRKRKAFADSELESSSHLFALASPSSVSNLSSPYARLSMLTLPQTMHLSSVIDYNAIQQSIISNESDTAEYFSSSTTTTIENFQLHECSSPRSPSPSPSPNRIRIIDDAKLTNMNRRNNNEPLIYRPSINEHIHGQSQSPNNCSSAKPKLSFSIESIIGIK